MLAHLRITMAGLTWKLLLLLLSFCLLEAAQAQRPCSAPLQYQNTKLKLKTLERHKFSDGEKVYYTCGYNYTSDGGSGAVQCRDGQWTKLTLNCEKISCGNAGDLPNGELRYEGTAVVGERVFAVCSRGFTLTTRDFMTCERDGWMGQFPRCEKIKGNGAELLGRQLQALLVKKPSLTEGATSCPPPKVQNSAGSETSVYQVGQSVSITCSPGFQRQGAEKVWCNKSGQWHPKPPQCRPSLAHEEKQAPPDGESIPAGSCSAPTDVNDPIVHLADRYSTRKTFEHKARVQFVCTVGYTPAGGSRFRRCIDGRWTPLTLECERQLCGSAGELLYGEFIYTGVQFGDTATAVCDEGYRLVGQATTRHCMDFGWDGRVPVCEAVQCDKPPVVRNAEHNGPLQPPYRYRTAVQYQCRVGALIGSRDVWCTKDGTWSGAPQCKEITCRPPRVPNASWNRFYNKEFQYRDGLSINCKSGYKRIGPSSITCDERGRWFPSVPKCRRGFY